jgi:hypothetical protein
VVLGRLGDGDARRGVCSSWEARLGGWMIALLGYQIWIVECY